MGSTRRPVVAGFAAGVLAIASGVALLLLPSHEEPSIAPLASEASRPLRSDRVDRDADPMVRSFSPDRGGAAVELAPERGPRPDLVPRRLVVRYEPGVGEPARRAARAALGARLLERLPLERAEVLTLPPGMSVTEAERRLSFQRGVAYAEPDFVYRAAATPNDPRFGALWGLHATSDVDIDAPEAWDVFKGDPAMTVGVVDTGVAYDHPDLAGNIWSNPAEVAGTSGVDDDGNGFVDDVKGWDWIDSDADPRDLHGHGTHVAGTIAASGNDGFGVVGVAWDASLVPLRVLDANGAGTSSSTAAAFAYAGKLGFDVVNASLGGPGASQAVLDAIERYPETLYVVAAGNDGADNDQVGSYPCNFTAANIVCVAAISQTGSLAGFSNYGATTVDLGAPGTNILSTVPKLASFYSEGFEQPLTEGWGLGGEGSTWTIVTDPYGGFVSDSPSSSYAPGSDTWIASTAAADLTNGESCRLRYALSLDTKSPDSLIVEASRDASSWTKVAGWAGSSNGWIAMSEDLSRFDGGPAYLRFRLVANTDAQVGAGAEIDDVSIVCASTAYSGDEYDWFSGTSMATPHVAGAAGLLSAAAPDASALEIKTALLGGTTVTTELQGQTVSGGRLNLAGSLVLLRPVSVPALGPAPSPSPSPSPTPSPSPSPSGETSAVPEPPTSPSPTSDGSPASPAPSPSPSETPAPSAERRIELRLAKHLVARGTVTADPGDCGAGVKVVLERKGARVDVTRTDRDGRFRVRLPDRQGRYRAVAVARRSCPKATDAARHLHGSRSFAMAEDSCWETTRREARVLAAVDAERRRSGNPDLVLDGDLSAVARAHASEMANAGVVAPTTSGVLAARVLGWERLTEFVAGTTDIASARDGLLDPRRSPDLYDPATARIGAGVVSHGGRVWVTLLVDTADDPGTTMPLPDC